MTNKLLITDTFFISDNHVKQLIDAGYEVTRLEKSAADEDELIEALKGVSVYIIGGIEQVTAKVIESTTDLKAIIFSGVDYSKFIPAADVAEAKGIKLLNAPGANAVGVAEFAIGVAIAMQRQLFTIGRTGNQKFITTKSIEDSVVGVVGAGNIGQKILTATQVFNPKELLYCNRSAKEVNAKKVDTQELVQSADLIFLTLPMGAGTIFDEALINNIKSGALLVSISPNNLINYAALLQRLQRGEIRAAVDWPSPTPEFDELPLDVWFSVNSHSAYNTIAANDNVDDSVTTTAISLLNQI